MGTWRYEIHLLVFNLEISLIRCAHSWDIELNTREINFISQRTHVLFSIYQLPSTELHCGTYHTLLQTRRNPGILLGILRLLSLVLVSFFQFTKVVPDVSHRGVFGKQAVHHQFVGCFLYTLDIMFLWFAFAGLADFSVDWQTSVPEIIINVPRSKLNVFSISSHFWLEHKRDFAICLESLNCI